MPLDKGKSAFTLPKLPYAEDALAPVISAKTISFHYGKHHKAYVDKLNELVEGTPYAEDVARGTSSRESAKDEKAKKIFNNAAQAWNHDFYWHSMRRKADAPGRARSRTALQDSFGGLDDFKKASAGRRRPVRQRLGMAGRQDGKLAIERPPMPTPRSPTATRRCSPSMCGSMPTSSTTRTGAPDHVTAFPRQARQLGVRREEARLIKEEISCLAPFF